MKTCGALLRSHVLAKCKVGHRPLRHVTDDADKLFRGYRLRGDLALVLHGSTRRPRFYVTSVTLLFHWYIYVPLPG